MAKQFVDPIVVKKGNQDFVVVKLGFRAKEFADFLIKHRTHIEDNNGWLNVDILKGKNDPNKWYASFDDWVPGKVKSTDHSPDREDHFI